MGRGNRIALVFRGDDATRKAASAKGSRLVPVAEALAAVGLSAEDAVFNEEWADEVRAQLLEAAGVLVWVDPVDQAGPLVPTITGQSTWLEIEKQSWEYLGEIAPESLDGYMTTADRQCSSALGTGGTYRRRRER